MIDPVIFRWRPFPDQGFALVSLSLWNIYLYIDSSTENPEDIISDE